MEVFGEGEVVGEGGLGFLEVDLVVVEVLDCGEGGCVEGVGRGELGGYGGEVGGEVGFLVYEGVVVVEGEGFEGCEGGWW